MMPDTPSETSLGKDQIARRVIPILERMTSDWELGFSGGIGPETRLVGDLGIDSVSMVEVQAAIGAEFGREDLPFERMLFVDGEFVEDLSVRDLVEFVDAALSGGLDP
jgi:acyl carrier protein